MVKETDLNLTSSIVNPRNMSETQYIIFEITRLEVVENSSVSIYNKQGERCIHTWKIIGLAMI